MLSVSNSYFIMFYLHNDNRGRVGVVLVGVLILVLASLLFIVIFCVDVTPITMPQWFSWRIRIYLFQKAAKVLTT